MRKLTPDEQKKAIAIGAFVLLAAGIVSFELRDTNPSPPPATAVAPAAATPRTQAAAVEHPVAGKKAEVALDLDPTLRMGPMLVTESLVYSGNGRNIFSANSAPEVVIPKPIAPPRPIATAPVVVASVGPPPPPPIDLKFFGTATAGNGKRQAFLLHGDDVFLASEGDVVQRRYRIVSMTANTIVVRDLTNNNQQTLPLIIR